MHESEKKTLAEYQSKATGRSLWDLKSYENRQTHPGVERGVAEFLVGHKFGLDANYLRMMEEKLRAEYMKAIDHFTFLEQPMTERLEDQLKKKESELLAVNGRLARLEGQFETKLKTRFTSP